MADTPIPAPSSGDGIAARLDEDLITTVRKATEQDANRCYGSAGGLADDLEHFRNHEPISARPPDTASQSRKLVRRQRVAAAFISVVGNALLADTFWDRPDRRASVEGRRASSYRAPGDTTRGDSLDTAALAPGRRVLGRDAAGATA